MPRITGLFLYPVKSLRGYAVPTAEVDALGLAGDRRFLVVDDGGQFLTQRTVTCMARVDARLAGGTLTLSAEGAGSVAVPTRPDPAARLRTVTIWKSSGLQAEDCGPDATAWLGACLGLSCHLVRIGGLVSRPVLKAAAQPGDVFAFADGAPILAVSEASLARLNDRIVESGGEPVPMDRFRPNVVIDGCDAFAEDAWRKVRAGDVVVRSAGKSARCIVTTTDQLTGERGKEPLKTLAAFRRNPADPSEVYFGVNLINESKRGTLRVGDQVTEI